MRSEVYAFPLTDRRIGHTSLRYIDFIEVFLVKSNPSFVSGTVRIP